MKLHAGLNTSVLLHNMTIYKQIDKYRTFKCNSARKKKSCNIELRRDVVLKVRGDACRLGCEPVDRGPCVHQTPLY